MKTLAMSFAAISLFAGAPALAQTYVTPEQVMKLPPDTRYEMPTGGHMKVTNGQIHFNGAMKCGKLSKAGGNKNAVINCEAPNGAQLRVEWLDLSRVQVEVWPSMAAKAGATQNKPAHQKYIAKRI